MRRWNVKTTYWFLFPLIIDIKIRPEWCIFLTTKNKKTILNLETHIATVQFGIGVCFFFYYFFAHKLKKFTWKCSNAFLFTLHLLKVTFSLGVHWVWVCLQYLFTRYDMCGSYEFGRGKDTLLSNSFVIFFYPLRAMCFFFLSFSFYFIKSCWSAIISPPQIKAHQTLLSILHTHTQTHTHIHKHLRHSSRQLNRKTFYNSYDRYFSCFHSWKWATIGLPWICIFKLIHTEPKIQSERQRGEEWKWSVFYHCTHFENIPNSYWFFKDK